MDYDEDYDKDPTSRIPSRCTLRKRLGLLADFAARKGRLRRSSSSSSSSFSSSLCNRNGSEDDDENEHEHEDDPHRQQVVDPLALSA